MEENENKTYSSVQVTATEDNRWPFESVCVHLGIKTLPSSVCYVMRSPAVIAFKSVLDFECK